ncbi:23S rRNA (pseudouridine(1915)-N(3))-methyltransferase RlmH, partial [Desulfovibrio sp. OttesenSCG-928-G11]|nr:23S rRNA (pseudouridine(1915)-N(3))-methyltransferase RlmH [Desulfovibrio sp. OttesenSCG-928-G11]
LSSNGPLWSMKRIIIISVGKIREKHWQEAAEHYRRRLKHFAALEEIRVRDADPSLPLEARLAQEGERIRKALERQKSFCPIFMDEKGELFESSRFAALLRGLYENGKAPCFVIGGAFGLDPGLAAGDARRMALGPMTFTHEMAQVLLLEQLYRAENINAGTGYHH